MSGQLSIQELLHQLETSGDRASMELVKTIIERGQDAVPLLRKVLQDMEYWEASGDKTWMTLHAVKLLGMIADPEALPELVNALPLAHEFDDEWIMEDLPTVFGRIGSRAIEPLEEFILAHAGNDEMWWERAAAADGLASVAMHHPEERQRILTLFHGLFSENDDPVFLGFVAGALLDIKDPSSIPVLEKAFDLGYIDESIVSRANIEETREITKEIPYQYNRDLLEFYEPDEIARRQERWKKEKEKEEHLLAEKREKREKSISIELKRLEVATKLIERNPLSLIRKTGRNDPCPCGSGKKYKKCCHLLVQAVPPKQVLSGRLYASPEFLQRASPYDTVLILENLTALALQAEEDGDAATAMEIFRKLEPVAEHSESGMLGNLLNYWGDMCSNHPELGDEGLAVLRKRQAYYKDKNREQWAFAIMDEADYLDRLGRWEEGLQKYGMLAKEMSEFPWVHIRFARFMERGSRFDDAVELYKKVLQMDDLVDSGDLVMVAEELKELAAAHNIELDSETKEEIELLLEN